MLVDSDGTAIPALARAHPFLIKLNRRKVKQIINKNEENTTIN